MYHILINLAIGRREQNIWGYKKLQGAAKEYKGAPKIVSTFFLETLKW